MMGAVQITFAHPDAEFDLAARQGGEAVAIDDEVARDQREKIRGLGPRVVPQRPVGAVLALARIDDIAVRQQDRERSEEHTSELQSLMRISYAVFCLKKKKQRNQNQHKYIRNDRKKNTY